MKTYATDTDVTLSVAFVRDGQPVIPEPNTVEFTVYDHTGVPIHTGSVATGAADYGVRILVPAEKNAITTSFSKRTVIVRATSGGMPIEERVVYRLMPFALHSVTPQDVRSYLGLDDSDLPDDDIDIAKAYLELQIEVGRGQFDAALSSGEEPEIRANDAIIYKTVLDLIPSLQNRVAQAETDGGLSFKRNPVRDYNSLATLTRERLSSALSLITIGVEPSYTFMTTTNDADPITG